ncbi:MAG: glycosyltransferase [Mesorhizobium sp.]|nr:glycosyltransferase [Mesorhizobium sp. M1E.F.Ca.ET.041.01.1.1]RUW86105.1 glycosyltransferase [Mesorhizobium sp. M1E.F.Ca.ET.063.01.1.1]RWD89975.1 MAG: glycosyltransferase [Mesorhizobium sp.]RWD95956.1 MAG: glycosyltransferase [Mesorhizobium sp.]TIV55859.1 MAG: glycosyltransferase [Mesorhizobium sp.]
MDVLPELVAQIERVLSVSELSKSFEIVLVNDCSPDKSWLIIEDLAKENQFVRGVSLRKNAGQHNAIMAGLRFSRGDIIIIMDDDLQHPPSALLQLAGAIAAGSDVCYTRYRGRQHTAWKRWGSKFNDWAAAAILKKPRGLYLSSFKALSRDIADAILLYDGPYTYVDGLILNTTGAISSIDIDHQKRWAGEGNYNLKKSVSLWLKMATGSSIYPLRLATIAGFLVAGGSLLVLGYVVAEKITHPEMQPGWASLIATTLFIGGLQMIFLGILGEYIGRIYVRVNNMPQFVVARTTFAREITTSNLP